MAFIDLASSQPFFLKWTAVNTEIQTGQSDEKPSAQPSMGHLERAFPSGPPSLQATGCYIPEPTDAVIAWLAAGGGDVLFWVWMVTGRLCILLWMALSPAASGWY